VRQQRPCCLCYQRGSNWNEYIECLVPYELQHFHDSGFCVIALCIFDVCQQSFEDRFFLFGKDFVS